MASTVSNVDISDTPGAGARHYDTLDLGKVIENIINVYKGTKKHTEKLSMLQNTMSKTLNSITGGEPDTTNVYEEMAERVIATIKSLKINYRDYKMNVDTIERRLEKAFVAYFTLTSSELVLQAGQKALALIDQLERAKKLTDIYKVSMPPPVTIKRQDAYVTYV